MNKIIFDASALLALLHQEKGYEVVEKHLPVAVMSVVNVCEAISILIEAGISENSTREMTTEIIKEIVPFDLEQGFVSANMKKFTRPYGLSFGDRACFALAKIRKLPVLTADKIWEKIDQGVKVILIR